MKALFSIPLLTMILTLAFSLKSEAALSEKFLVTQTEIEDLRWIEIGEVTAPSGNRMRVASGYGKDYGMGDFTMVPVSIGPMTLRGYDADGDELVIVYSLDHKTINGQYTHYMPLKLGPPQAYIYRFSGSVK